MDDVEKPFRSGVFSIIGPYEFRPRRPMVLAATLVEIDDVGQVVVIETLDDDFKFQKLDGNWTEHRLSPRMKDALRRFVRRWQEACVESTAKDSTLDPTCFLCATVLSPAFPDAATQPHGGVVFTTYGQYGSTVFDPMDDTSLSIVICDACLTQRAGRVLHWSADGDNPALWNPETTQ